MTEQTPQPTVYVVYGDAGAPFESATGASLSDRGLLVGQGFEPKVGHMVGREVNLENVSAQKSGGAGRVAAGSPGASPVYDPHAVHREFPDRWRAYIRANYRNLNHVQQVFGVSERAARKWWNGETGANGGYVAIAMREHPVAASRMLFAAE